MRTPPPQPSSKGEGVQQLKQDLVDALSMMERAEVIDFNGHMSCRLPGTGHLLINAGASVRSSLSAA
ncbi:MAG TPA: hypothetical protein VFJ62_17930, partial [Usitatibacter sp.]|nr:hypothetical protein [Usitatibacter sp.]